MLKILFAPLQGYTTGIYRKAHAEIFGGVDAYYAPFLRIENGKPREKDLRDLETSNPQHSNSEKQTYAKTVPQIIANSVDEFKVLTDALIAKGYTEIDFNMGCPFPMQVNRHRGAGLLSDTQTVQAIMDEIKKFSSAANGTAVWIDGVISGISACLAVMLCPESADYMFATHATSEPAGKLIMERLGLEPVLYAGMHLGEGTGAAAVLPLADQALNVYYGLPRFAEGNVEPYQHLK